MSLLAEYKWYILIAAEVLFWVFSISFVIVRYWFQLHRLSLIFLILFIVNDLFILSLAILDYMQTGEFSNYQLIIAIILIYALTYGKKDFKKLDAYLKEKVEKWKNPSRHTHKGEEKSADGGSDWEHARRERNGWFKHLLIYAIAHGIYFLMMTFQWEAISFETLSNISSIWTIILVVDGVYSLSFTIFPRKRK
ncbi:hypothetical protein [Desmospora activa]|uniref:2TM domain-containing protein n=1 Tax=Desmospora activa DSM 45169 TaxID=1121389 RepID=A0A2T4ZAB7_9BACL|nr:hypothetical protein [Desmospora activa]PTM58833.1 hypothetical protein C8J48_1427 [Desmospora activa DSM 45169]